MIDLDLMEKQLDRALTLAVPPAPVVPAPVPPPASAPAHAARPSPPPPPRAPARRVAAPAPPPPPRPEPVPRLRPSKGVFRKPAPVELPETVPELLELGMLHEADALIARTADRVDAVTWTTMRALLDGRSDAAAAGVEELHRMAQAGSAAEARYWLQRFWAAVEWGTDDERCRVLDHCRERAYRFDDVQWWGNLTLILAGLGKHDEAVRAFDEAVELLAVVSDDARRLDVVTNLIEAAALLGDAPRLSAAARFLRAAEGRLVVVGPGVVCKGSIDRYRALAHAAAGRWAQAEECFRRAEAVHRAIGAGPLLERTLDQAARPVVAA